MSNASVLKLRRLENGFGPAADPQVSARSCLLHFLSACFVPCSRTFAPVPPCSMCLRRLCSSTRTRRCGRPAAVAASVSPINSTPFARRACVLSMFVTETVVVVQPQQALQATVACSDLHGIAGPKHVRPPSLSRNAPLSSALTLPLATHFPLQMAINRWSSRTLTWIPTCSTECALYIRTRDGLHTRCSRCGLLVLTIRPQCCMMIRFHFLHPHFAPSPHAASRATCSRPRSLLGRRSGMFPRKSLQQAK